MKHYIVPITVLMLSIALVIGWFINIGKLIGGSMDITGEFILRIIGVFAFPIGSIMGFL